MNRKRPERKPGSKAFPAMLPCGCRPTQLRAGDVVICDDGTRICRHAKRWRLAWREVTEAPHEP